MMPFSEEVVGPEVSRTSPSRESYKLMGTKFVAVDAALKAPAFQTGHDGARVVLPGALPTAAVHKGEVVLGASSSR